MRVRIVRDVRIAGYGVVREGDELDFSEDLARQLIGQEIAVSTTAKEEPEPESSARPISETLAATEAASKPRRRRRQ